MSPIARTNTNAFALAVVLVVIALCYQCRSTSFGLVKLPNQGTTQVENRQEIQARALGNVVSGAIGTDSERGDSVYVVTRTR